MKKNTIKVAALAIAGALLSAYSYISGARSTTEEETELEHVEEETEEIAQDTQ